MKRMLHQGSIPLKREKVYRIAKSAQGSRKGVSGTVIWPPDSKSFQIQRRANGYSRMSNEAKEIKELWTHHGFSRGFCMNFLGTVIPKPGRHAKKSNCTGPNDSLPSKSWRRMKLWSVRVVLQFHKHGPGRQNEGWQNSWGKISGGHDQRWSDWWL